MKKDRKLSFFIIISAILSSAVLTDSSTASVATVEEQEPKYKLTARPSEQFFIERSPSVNDLVSNVTVGVIQGVDSNPLLDSTHKADSYTQEMVDVHYRYPLFKSLFGSTDSKFGFNVTNVNYYRINDVDIFDAAVDANIEQELLDSLTMTAGYVFEMMWFPHDTNGTYAANQVNVSIRQKLAGWLYQKTTYRFLIKNFTCNKVLLGNKTRGEPRREDSRNVFENELGAYIGKSTKVKIVNQFYFNESNYTYVDFYDYFNYKVGGSVIQFFTKKFYCIGGFSYQRRNYDSRYEADRQSRQKDNLYTVTGSLLYDLNKNVSIFINYSHSENHSNEPLDRYVDSLYSAGVYYAF
ncbi:MAG: outer membrane beta-barrel protein [Candidatus Omnitrophota bacterium]